MSHFRHSVLELVGEVATTHPRTWIYSFVAAGMAVAVGIYAGLGLWIGGLVGHATYGMYTGLALYAYWFIQNVEVLKSQADIQVAQLEEFRALLK